MQTSKGNEILNSGDFVDWGNQLVKQQLNELRKKYLGLYIRNESSEVYNCHGLTFACRRTNIFEPNEIHKILKDDEYQELTLNTVQPGDTVLYFGEKGDIEHSAIVIECPNKGFNIPIVISKWGSAFEVIHSVYNCPYDKSNIKYYRCIL